MSTFISDFEGGLLIIIMPSCQAIVMFWLAQRMVELGTSLRQDPSWLRPEWAQESPLLATGFFLDAFAVSPRVFSVGRGRVVVHTKKSSWPYRQPQTWKSLRWPSANEALNVYSLAGA